MVCFREIAFVLKYENALQINPFSCFYATKGTVRKKPSERGPVGRMGDVN